MIYIIIAISIIGFILFAKLGGKKKVEKDKFKATICTYEEWSNVFVIDHETNTQRVLKNIDPIIPIVELTRIAQLRIDEIDQDFSHNLFHIKHKPELKKKGLKLAGENIIKGVDPQNMVSTWMKSEGHRKNILNPHYTYTGIAVGKIGKVWYGVQIFGR